MTVYFVYTDGECNTKKTKLGSGTEKECNSMMVHYFNKVTDEKVYYTRGWTRKDGIRVVDYGSWSNFFYFVPDEMVDRYERGEIGCNA